MPRFFCPTITATIGVRNGRRGYWFGGGWKVDSELLVPAAFAGAMQSVTPDGVAASIPCGADVDSFVDAIRAFPKAGFTHVALVQIGGDHQASFINWAHHDLLPALRAARAAYVSGCSPLGICFSELKPGSERQSC